MKKFLTTFVFCLSLSAIGYAADTSVAYNCQFKVNKQKFTTAQEQQINAFIVAREKVTVAELVKSLGGTQKDAKESVAAVKVGPANFLVAKDLKNLKDTKFTVSGSCHVHYKAKEAFGVDIERDRVFSKVLTHLSHRDILAIEDYIADLADYRTPINRDINVSTDLSYVG
ncbi:MAG: hypothetical protein A3F17_02945 [Gammaproteobacteria bacterium RIFCSPHIGHO2_12_FULL_41_15]|nr:MAG: hypothetical protein A3F17_02945 [Gammaproteobacteria bacterium RIFCSPHIGHO2_12_FULL_41_15]